MEVELTSPEPGGDMITSGSLSFDPTTGLGTLTLITNNTHLGVNGTETLSLNFVNSNHALIIQADGSATSSGSFDLQTLPSTPGGGYSFTLSRCGEHRKHDISSEVCSACPGPAYRTEFLTRITRDSIATRTTPLPERYRRRIPSVAVRLTGTGIAGTLVYYIVGPEALRLIDVDTAGTLVGSAYGQGIGKFHRQLAKFSVQRAEQPGRRSLFSRRRNFPLRRQLYWSRGC